MGRPRTPLETRFWIKVDKSGGEDACWFWTGNKNRGGYGKFRDADSGKSVPAHRVALQLNGVNVPSGRFVLHHCDTPSCVRPDHLYVGDHASNMADRQRRGRQAQGSALIAACAPNRARGDRAGARLHPERLARGSRHGKSKLTEQGAAHARWMRSRGYTLKAIARYLKVDPTTIGRICRFEAWRHV